MYICICIMYLAFVPSSWHRAPNTLGISSVIGVSSLTHKTFTTRPEFKLMTLLKADLEIAAGWGLSAR